MTETDLETKIEIADGNGNQLLENGELSSILYIGDGARYLQAISDKHDHEFLSYVLRLVVLETEIMAEKYGIVSQSKMAEPNGKAKLC